MKKVFIKTRNVKNFISFMSGLQELPPNIPKMGLVFGNYGLGKSETIQWWCFKNKCVYIRANQGMTRKWLLSEIAQEMGERPNWNAQENFELIERKLRENPQTIIIDEVDYLIEKKTVETLRDLHDRTGCPMVLVGMEYVDKKLSKYPHLLDRIYKTFKFDTYNKEDIKQILAELSDIKITPDGLEYLSTRGNQFRQIVKLINQIEKLAKTNQIVELNEHNLMELLNERKNIATLQATKQLYA